MKRCRAARQCTIAALWLAVAACVPVGALAAESGALPAASSAPAASGSGGTSSSSSPASAARPVETPPSSPVVVDSRVTPVDWFVRASALLGQLVMLALAVACGLLAWSAFVVLREALGMAPRRVDADPPASGDPSPSDSNVARSPPGASAPPLSPAIAAQPFTFQRHWGGFGGASTGWVLSERLVRVMVGLVLAGLAAGLGMQLVPHEASAGKAEATASGGAASAAKPRD